MDNLRDLLVHSLQDMYSAETQALRAMPLMAEATQNAALRRAMEQHMKETERQVQRLEQVAQAMGVQAQGEECAAMKGLIEEATKFMEEDATPEVADAGLIAMAQKMEHYEIACYGSAIAWCRQLGEMECAQMLEETLLEEKATDMKLTQVAENRVNEQAAS